MFRISFFWTAPIIKRHRDHHRSWRYQRSTDNGQIFAGQRYSFILQANQPVANYWMRALHNVGTQEFSRGVNSAILRYSGAPNSDPTTNQTTSVIPCLKPTSTRWRTQALQESQLLELLISISIWISHLTSRNYYSLLTGCLSTTYSTPSFTDPKWRQDCTGFVAYALATPFPAITLLNLHCPEARPEVPYVLALTSFWNWNSIQSTIFQYPIHLHKVRLCFLWNFCLLMSATSTKIDCLWHCVQCG